MGVLASAARIRHDLQTRLLDARSRTDDLFRIVREEAMYDRPIPERHRIIFYVGHLEAFDWNLLAGRAFGLKSSHPSFNRLFAFGIDPVDGGLPSDQASDWPRRQDVDRYSRTLRDQLDTAIARALARPAEGHPMLTTMLETAIEHRLMHAETLAYMLHQLPFDKKVIPKPDPQPDAHPRAARRIEIPAGSATLGLAGNGRFGWDNEFAQHQVDVPAFAIDSCKVTNGEFQDFVRDGGYRERSLWTGDDWEWINRQGIQHPLFWRRDDERWLQRTMFAEVPLPEHWPVYVSQAEAAAYARLRGCDLPTEAQFHRAAYGTPSGEEREWPWGDAPAAPQYGNFDFLRWDPVPVQSYPAGASASGVEGLVGNGWEWTSTPFTPFPGFEPFRFYRGYSADFFDGKHYVMKGGSPRTARCLLRRSFRNWFQPHYQYVYAGFRCVRNR